MVIDIKIIDTKRIKENAMLLLSRYKLWAVVKNDAYGLGLITISSKLIKAGVKNFAVISLHEAVLLRELSKEINILLLGTIPLSDIDIILENRIIVSVNDKSDLDKLESNVLRAVKVNCDLNRFGVSIDEAKEIEGEFYYSHLALPNSKLAKEYLDFGIKQIGSSKLLIGEEVRVGYLLYKNAMSIIDEICFVRNVKKGEMVGYDYKVEEDMRIGILNIGYYNGLVKANQGRMVYVKGKFTPILSIAMNHCFIALTDEMKIGDEVEILGPHITIDDVAAYLKTSPYEVLVSFKEIERKYL